MYSYCSSSTHQDDFMQHAGRRAVDDGVHGAHQHGEPLVVEHDDHRCGGQRLRVVPVLALLQPRVWDRSVGHHILLAGFMRKAIGSFRLWDECRVLCVLYISHDQGYISTGRHVLSILGYNIRLHLPRDYIRNKLSSEYCSHQILDQRNKTFWYKQEESWQWFLSSTRIAGKYV